MAYDENSDSGREDKGAVIYGTSDVGCLFLAVVTVLVLYELTGKGDKRTHILFKYSTVRVIGLQNTANFPQKSQVVQMSPVERFLESGRNKIQNRPTRISGKTGEF